MFAGFNNPSSEYQFSHFEKFHSFPPHQRRSTTFKYYDALGVSLSASANEIRKAFQQLAKRVHPDKGGDSEKFKEISEAYEVLKDENKRRKYNKVGDDGIQDGFEDSQDSLSGGSTVGDDLFDEYFESLFPEFPTTTRKSCDLNSESRTRDSFSTLEVPLEDIYNGNKHRLNVIGKCSCVACMGTGFNGALQQSCAECHGHGKRVVVVKLGNGIAQKVQKDCVECGGSGFDTNPSSYCQVCCGSGQSSQNKVIDINVKQGMEENHEIRFHGESPSTVSRIESGDLIVIVRSVKHPLYQRINCDLLTVKRIGICESLCGIDFDLIQLDGRKLRVKTKPGEIIKPGQVKCLDGEGLPVSGQPHLKGNLYIQFEIIYPNGLSPQQQETIRVVLQGPQRLQKGQNDNGFDAIHPDQCHSYQHLYQRIRDVCDLRKEFKSRETFGQLNGATGYDTEDSEDDPNFVARNRCAQQ